VNTLVWVLVGIFSLNVLAVGWLVILELVERHRLDREIKEVDALWRSLTTPLSATVAWAGGNRFGSGAPSIHMRPDPRHSIGRVSVAVAVAAALVWIVALSPGDPRTITSADSFVRAASPQGQGAFRRINPFFTAERPVRVPTQVPVPGTPDVSVATSVDEAVPATVAAEPDSSNAIYIDWARVPAATGYEVERRKEDTGRRFHTIVTVSESVTAYTDVGLASDTTYFYRVSALTNAGAAPPSDVVSATTPAVSPPAATDVTAAATSDAIVLTWADVADETGYRIERSLDGTTDWMVIGTTGQDVTVYADVALSPGTTYHYRVVATNGGGDSAPSNIATATTEPAPITEDPPNEEPPKEEPPPGTEASESPAPTP
jgi:hypothetical protein